MIVFIIPYRDRDQQRQFFATHMKMVLEGIGSEIYYIHQTDSRGFNRGAMKNIGFLAMRNKYPNYRDITFVFNDIDTMPYTRGFLNYETTPGIIKHFYGFTHALGGIVSINGGDFERMNGFPNLWAWGFEDNALQARALTAGIRIDRSQFYPIHDKNIMHFQDGFHRTINRGEFERHANNTAGLYSIHNLTYDIDSDFVNVKTFMTETPENLKTNAEYDLRNGNAPFSLHQFLFKRPLRGRI